MSRRESRMKRIHVNLFSIIKATSKRNGLSDLECSKLMAEFLKTSKFLERSNGFKNSSNVK